MPPSGARVTASSSSWVRARFARSPPRSRERRRRRRAATPACFRGILRRSWEPPGHPSRTSIPLCRRATASRIPHRSALASARASAERTGSRAGGARDRTPGSAVPTGCPRSLDPRGARAGRRSRRARAVRGRRGSRPGRRRRRRTPSAGPSRAARRRRSPAPGERRGRAQGPDERNPWPVSVVANPVRRSPRAPGRTAPPDVEGRSALFDRGNRGREDGAGIPRPPRLRVGTSRVARGAGVPVAATEGKGEPVGRSFSLHGQEFGAEDCVPCALRPEREAPLLPSTRSGRREPRARRGPAARENPPLHPTGSGERPRATCPGARTRGQKRDATLRPRIPTKEEKRKERVGRGFAAPA